MREGFGVGVEVPLEGCTVGLCVGITEGDELGEGLGMSDG
jgi:hypothetical protein